MPHMLFEKENATNVFGQNLFWGGVGALIGPPFAGLIGALTRSFYYLLFTITICIAMYKYMKYLINMVSCKHGNLLSKLDEFK